MILQYLNYIVVLEFVSFSLLNYGNKYHRILRVLQETIYILEATICEQTRFNYHPIRLLTTKQTWRGSRRERTIAICYHIIFDVDSYIIIYDFTVLELYCSIGICIDFSIKLW